MLGPLLDVFYPRRCAGCGSGAWPFCPACRRGLVPLTPPWCARCGCPAPADSVRCRGCPPGSIAIARAPFLFRGPARAAIHRLKFSGWRVVAEALGEAMLAMNAFEADAVAFVPLSRARLAERGYDQARALADVVARRLVLPLRPMLARPGTTPPQARRTARERRLAMRGMFVADGRAPPSRVLLVDDVLTTGATAGACASALLEAGVREVGLLTAARAVSGPLPARCYTRSGSRLGLWLPGGDPR